MPRKKPMQYVPLEERAEFIAALEALPADPVELEARASRVLQLYHDAMLVADVQALNDAHLVYRACVVKLNGGTNFGSASIRDALAAKFSAPSGQVPKWGQAGEFLLDVEGMRIVVKMDVGSLANHCGAELRAVDFDQPFISRTGYRHQLMAPAQHVGRTVDQAVRAEVLEFLAGEGKAVTIDQEHSPAKDRKVWPWLADALAGVRPDGQMAMFGDAPKDPNAKVALSNAERQRRHRLRLKELADTEGLKAIALTKTDRMVLSLGLLAHEDLDHRPKDWATTKKPGFDALLTKLWPEGDGGRYLAEPNRSSHRPAGRLRDEIDHQKVVIRRLVEDNTVLRTGQTPAPAEVVTDTANPHNWLRTVELTQDDDRLMFHAFSVFFTARSDLEYLESPFVLLKLERIFQGSPLWTERAKAELDKDLGIINGNKRREADRKRGWKNYEDERAQNAKLFRQRAEHLAEIKRLRETVEQISEEIGGGAAPVGLVSDDAAKLRRQVAELEQENARVIVERGRALEAAEVLQARLKKAGLPFDYRKQPGE